MLTHPPDTCGGSMPDSIQSLLSLMIIGAEKAATTALLRYLDYHPDLVVHSHREMGFFTDDDQYVEGLEQALSRYYPDGITDNGKLIAKNVGLLYSEKGLQRLKLHNPQILLVVILRNPVDRAYSAFWEARRKGRLLDVRFEDEIFDSAGKIREVSPFVNRSLYGHHIARLLKVFPRDQIIPLVFSNFIREPSIGCEEILRRMDLPGLYIPYQQLSVENPSALPRSAELAKILYTKDSYAGIKRIVRFIVPRKYLDRARDLMRSWNERQEKKPPLDPETRSRLAAYFRPSNRLVSDLLELDLSKW